MPSTDNQRTLGHSVSCQGVGLHSGATVNLTLRPAPAHHGILFVRTDTPRPVLIPALSEYVVDTALATTLGKDGVKVSTVEHLLSALAGLGIDNVRVEVDGPEVPVMDGSAAHFVQMVMSAGIRELEEPRSYLVIKKSVTVTEGDKEATLSPSRRFRVSCSIDFKHPLISSQYYEMEMNDRSFSGEISRARTFGFLRDVEMLKKLGLARGGSLENAIVVDEASILNPEGLRFSDEFVRHKILDAIGDVSLFGRPVIGHLKVFKTGHALNHKLVQKVLADPSCYELVPLRRLESERSELRLPELPGGLELGPLLA
ncbi:UDP-3-O-acyl-N-acetylglucosamine deacetylase [Stigmatella sp. ncwal1]|uniref:UDP-3-O-acyl-N-acetylglucosamine deacetylase n=1 Tax=Stigmatella ashevillensis TaxID=2995309 RepID=A0ABT5D6C8_9BACT|nr:UDP-3-O-acyl-N-acetylglucosamine deacetylase [Stigmatella ashevillena]MDC0709101.1 UDP-3-O-acyl-N-acetylglucosamine deacetylase [Stigmatella ashevillena]